MCDSLTVAPLGEGSSAANKQQSPGDSAGDYRRPDFIEGASRVYYAGVRGRALPNNLRRGSPSRLAGGKRRRRMRAAVALVSFGGKKGRGERRV